MNNMIAVDTSIFIDYLQQKQGDDIEILRKYLRIGDAWFSPVVITELVSAPKLKSDELELILSLPMLEIDVNYWQRAGETCRKILKKGLKARLGDAMIAQSCIDHDVPLLTRDKDFSPYFEHCGLKGIDLPI